jgi:hypothetical protein
MLCSDKRQQLVIISLRGGWKETLLKELLAEEGRNIEHCKLEILVINMRTCRATSSDTENEVLVLCTREQSTYIRGTTFGDSTLLVHYSRN